jgi:hypothetical protein
MGGNSGMMTRFGNSMPKASSSANKAPEAPTVGTGERVIAVSTSCTAAADSNSKTRHRLASAAGAPAAPARNPVTLEDAIGGARQRPSWASWKATTRPAR